MRVKLATYGHVHEQEKHSPIGEKSFGNIGAVCGNPIMNQGKELA